MFLPPLQKYANAVQKPSYRDHHYLLTIRVYMQYRNLKDQNKAFALLLVVTDSEEMHVNGTL